MSQDVGLTPEYSPPSFLAGSNQTSQSFYRTLNVEPNASKMMIREAYLRLKSMYQSGNDALYGLDSAGEVKDQLARIDEAFNTLNDDSKRYAYDVKVREGVLSFNSGYQSFSETIQTNRSTLRVIKTKALKATAPEVQAKVAELLKESDLGDGVTLQRLRELCEVSEAEMQDRTKISLEYIRSIESNRFERLPQAVYVKGFIRSYLRYLGVKDEEAIIQAFAARLSAWQQGSK
jgi:hypothetical protein